MRNREILRMGVVRAAGFGPKASAGLLAGQGSDRLFYRLTEAGRSAVLMVSPPGDPDFKRYIEIGRFLYRKGLGAPEIYEADPKGKSLVMEDLGDETLYAFARARKDKRSLAARYRKVVELLVALQTRTRRSLPECPSAARRTFDHRQLRWETDYFRKNFLEADMGVEQSEAASLAGEFDALARAVAKQPRRFMHRDFQSQNILLKDGRVRLVDFQGSRRGGFAYDLASLLKDAYVDLPRSLRDRLLEYYRAELAAHGGPALAKKDLERALLLAGLQRNMQALGAFSFLSRVKGKRRFRRFIPLCLRHLREGLAELNGGGIPPGPFPRLERVCAAVKPPAGGLSASRP
ncbi:MAG: phosphotransferase [Elusimicrobiota bacterium]